MAARIIQNNRRPERIFFPFPIKVSSGAIGETVNLSGNGLCINIDKPLDSARIISIQVDFPFSNGLPFNVHANLVWNKTRNKNKRYLYGVHFLRLNSGEQYILREAFEKHKLLNPSFVRLTNELRFFLYSIKHKLDNYESLHRDKKQQLRFLEKYKYKIFRELTKHFDKIGNVAKEFSRDIYTLHKKYYQLMLGYLLLDSIEINRFVNRKPFGYAGDFVVMTYIYDYHKKFMGTSLYEKLINAYTCSIPIARSVIGRKDFLKNEIQEALLTNKTVNILSVGSGPARELIELLREDKIQNKLNFDCLDFEQQALDFVKNEIKSVKPAQRKFLNIRFFHKTILDLIKNNNDTYDQFYKYDLIYSSGLFDYLSNKIVKKLVENLSVVLRKNGVMIITNVNKDKINARIYYEMLGEWELIYRSREEMMNWIRNIENIRDVSFANLEREKSFLFLKFRK